MRKFVKGKEGFTLIEIVLVIVIIAVLAGILIEPLRQGIQSYVGIETRADLTSQAREATSRIVREIRNIQKKANDKPNITSADATSITFVDAEDTSIRFYFDPGPPPTVRREDINLAADNILADKVLSFQVRYFDKDNGEISSPLDTEEKRNLVRRILVIMAMQEGTETVTMTGQAFLRDLRGL